MYKVLRSIRPWVITTHQKLPAPSKHPPPPPFLGQSRSRASADGRLLGTLRYMYRCTFAVFLLCRIRKNAAFTVVLHGAEMEPYENENELYTDIWVDTGEIIKATVLICLVVISFLKPNIHLSMA